MSINNFCIAISLRVVSHTEGSREVELSLFKVITECGLKVQVAVGRENKLRV